MRSPASFLRTRIARRVFGLFLLCAVLPTATLAGASYWMVTRELREQARTQLAQVAKVSGTLLLARLHEAEQAIIDVTEARGRDPSFVLHPRAPSAEAFAAVGIGDPKGSAHALLGVPKALPTVTAKPARDHLRENRTLLVVLAGAEGPSSVLLVRALQPGAADTPLVWGEVSPGYLWGDGAREPLNPADTDFCAYAQDVNQPLHCSSGEAELRVRSAFGPAGAAAVGGRSEVFLGFEFAAPPWTMQASRPLTAFSAPIEFRRSVLLTLALGLWLVVLASNVLLRHQLDPVAKLEEATRRVAAGDFSVAVAVSTKDELEDLATSFNTMAGRLREQFTLLGALHEVDREALGGRSDVEVARTALLHFPRLLPVSEALIAVRVPGDEPDATVVWRATYDGRVEQQLVTLPASSFAQLQAEPDHWLGGPAGPSPAVLEALEPAYARTHLVLPLLERGACFGAVVLSASSAAAGFSQPDVQRARQIADQVALALANSRLVQRLSAMSWGTLEALARSIDAVSPWTAGHSERVTRVSMAIGRQLGLSANLLDQLHRGGLLHDVGKIGVPSSILDKPGKLDDAEFQTIRAHPVIGARILEPIHAYEDVIPIVRHHHERFDGTGYPDRLAGRAIPYLARVLSVADVYDALVSRRPYREGWPHEKAATYITDRAGIEFDPDLVAGFLELVGGPEWRGCAAQYEHAATPVLTAVGR